MDGLIVVHGIYVPELSEPPLSGFLLWAEGPPDGGGAPERHPRSIGAESLEESLRPLGLASAPGGGARGAIASLALPARGGWPLAPSTVVRESGTGGPPALRWFDVSGVRLTPLETLDFVPRLAASLRARPQRLLTGDDLDYWAEAARWTFDLLYRRRVAPSADDVRPLWRPVLADPAERDKFQRFVAALPPAARTASSPGARGSARPGPLFPAPETIVRLFLEEITDAAAREFIRDVVPAERRRAGGGPEAAVVAALATIPAHPLSPDVLGRLREYSLPLLEPLPEGALALGIRVVPPPAEERDLPWSLRYHLASGESPPAEIDAAEVWTHSNGALRRSGRLFAAPQEALLARLSTAAAVSPSVRRSLEERHPVGAELTLEEAYRFLTQEAPLLAESGVRVLLPAERGLTRVSLRLQASEAGRVPALTRFGLETIVDFDWQIAVGDAAMTPAEFEELAARKIPLVAVRGEWVLLDREHLDRTLRLFDRRPGGRTTL
ncbi:MAG: SNF2 helicase-associated domain-containing protein, partial [Acidithiobacillales bacterium]